MARGNRRHIPAEQKRNSRLAARPRYIPTALHRCRHNEAASWQWFGGEDGDVFLPFLPKAADWCHKALQLAKNQKRLFKSEPPSGQDPPAHPVYMVAPSTTWGVQKLFGKPTVEHTILLTSSTSCACQNTEVMIPHRSVGLTQLDDSANSVSMSYSGNRMFSAVS
ncbi:hypothetical protein C8J57DRAFT_1229760 [Mycena rebaudengoi]|nr:hypothetical protein C8J57DRAFT_1229760 [Mycena rebaudengoi]